MDTKPSQRPHDSGFQQLNSAEQAYARLFYAAKSKGRVEVDLGHASQARQMRMRLYTFRRFIRGEQEKKGTFPYLGVVAEDLTISVDGQFLIIRDHLDSPQLQAMLAATEGALSSLTEQGVDSFGAVVEEVKGRQAEKPTAMPAPVNPQPSAQAAEASQQVLEDKLRKEMPELFGSNPYYSRES